MSGVKSKTSPFSAKNVCYFAVLLALILVLQLTGATIKITPATQLSFVLLPIVLGGMILGPIAGALLGFVFGLVVYLQGVFGLDAFTFILFTDHPILTALVCIVKGTCSGFVSGLIYKALSNKNQTVAAFISSASAPVVNTGLFILGALFMSDTLNANFVDGTSVIYFLVIGCAGVNFLIEFALNLILAPIILRVVRIVEKSLRK